FPELENTRRWAAVAPRIARAVGVRLVATLDCHYVYLEEAEVQKILHGLRPGNRQTLEERERDWGYNVALCPPPNDNTIYRKLRAVGLSKPEAIEAIVSTEEIAQSCTAVLPKLPMVMYPGKEEELRGLVQRGYARQKDVPSIPSGAAVDLRFLRRAGLEEAGEG